METDAYAASSLSIQSCSRTASAASGASALILMRDTPSTSPKTSAKSSTRCSGNMAAVSTFFFSFICTKVTDTIPVAFWLGNFADYLYDEKSNREAYNFWAKKQRARIHDPRKRDLLAPLEPPHPFGVKRPCLEQNYYEQFNRPNVDVVDISSKSGNSIAEFNETGIKTTDGKQYDFDVIAIATGFDITTGGMTNMGLKSVKGTYLKDEWKRAAYTYLGTLILWVPFGICCWSCTNASQARRSQATRTCSICECSWIYRIEPELINTDMGLMVPRCSPMDRPVLRRVPFLLRQISFVC